MREDALVDLCIRVQRQRLGLDVDAPISAEERAAMRSVLHVAAARSPGVVAHIEAHEEPVVVNELLTARARPVLEAVARQASAATGGDVTAALLRGSCGYTWLTEWRDLVCWRLASEGGIEQADIGTVMSRSQPAVSQAIGRHMKRLETAATATAPKAKEDVG